MGIAHEGELARGGSGPEKRLGRETRRRKGGAARESVLSPSGRFGSAVMLVKARRGVV